MTKRSLKFQKNRHKTVGGVPHRGTEGRTERRKDGWMDGRKDGKPKTMSLRFSLKRRGTIRAINSSVVLDETNEEGEIGIVLGKNEFFRASL